MKKRTFSASSAILLAVISLSGCSNEEHQDLKQWMKDSTQGLKGRVPPLPEVKAFPVVAYETLDLMDPFNPKKIEPNKRQSAAQGPRPDLNRRREPLEAFPLESLRMIGVLTQGKKSHAVIQADKTIHQVRVGNYMGQNFGVVTNVGDSEVVLKELIQDSSGEWVERTTTLQLQEKPQEARK
jgi:type IV pilus assembly protein PilP